jgi:hypothetical protein
MAVVKWTTPGSETNVAGSALNSLANGSNSARMAYDNSTTRDLYARVTVELGSITPSAGGSITLRYLGRRPTGSVDEDITAGLESYTMPLVSSAGTRRVIFQMVRIYPYDGGFVITNNSGVTLNASGNSVFVQTYNEDVS